MAQPMRQFVSFFGSFDEIYSTKVIKDKYTGHSRGLGFVEMGTLSQAQVAIKCLNGRELQGKLLSEN